MKELNILLLKIVFLGTTENHKKRFILNRFLLFPLFFHKEKGREGKREGEHIAPPAFLGIVTLFDCIRTKLGKKKIDVTLGIFCRWSHKSTEKNPTLKSLGIPFSQAEPRFLL